jgi:hypothetical protein
MGFQMKKVLQLGGCILILLSLTSCQTIRDIKAKRLAREAAADNADCLAKGFTQNTDAFRLCLDNRQLDRRVKRAERKAQEAIDEAESAAQGATTECILSGGVMAGSTCLK